MTVEQQEEEKQYPQQDEKDQKIADRIFQKFLRWRDNRNRAYDYFGYKSILEYINESNQRYNNYRIKPAWKEEWQANISDITTHAKLMAIVAQQVVNRYYPVYKPRFSKDLFSELRVQVLQDIYDFTETEMRNGELDVLMTILRAAREGTVLGFEGYKKTSNFEGIDAQFVAIEDFYPADMTKFNISEQSACIWRTVMSKDDFDEGYKGWYQADKVPIRAQAGAGEETSFFNISDEIDQDQVEILRYFEKYPNDEFYITANGVLITKPESKLSKRRQDKELGFWKSVFEIYDPTFFYGRSLPHLMKDNQDAIDYLFEGMFDKQMISIMRPILIGGVNQEVEGYNYPGRMTQMADVTQIKEMPVEPPDLTSFRVLKELKDRQHFVSVDEASQGVATGKKTATEVERAQEAAKRLNSVFGVLVKDAVVQKARLRASIIFQYLVNSEKYQQFITENTKLVGTGGNGTRIVRVKQKPSPSDQLFRSRKLTTEAALMRGGVEQNEIFELTPSEIKNSEFIVSTKAPSSMEMSPAMKRAFDLQWVAGARGNPQYDQEEVERQFSEAMEKDWDKVKAKGEQQPVSPEQTKGQTEQTMPSLKGMIGQTPTP